MKIRTQRLGWHAPGEDVAEYSFVKDLAGLPDPGAAEGRDPRERKTPKDTTAKIWFENSWGEVGLIRLRTGSRWLNRLCFSWMGAENKVGGLVTGIVRGIGSGEKRRLC